MATALGAGSLLATTWFLDPPAAVRARGDEAPPAPAPQPASGPVDSPATLDLLARVVWLLRSAASGLSLSELRTLLSEPVETLQRALAAGLRTKRIRRVGAHNKLRYVLNG
jgi:hypothetical protein